MGTLAKRGIIKGKTVPVEGMVEATSTTLESFTARTLSSLGYLQIAEKIYANEELEIEEIEQLLARAPLGVLLKLVSMSVDLTLPRVVPIITFPFERWIELGGISYLTKKIISSLTKLSYPGLNIAFDILDFKNLSGVWNEIVAVVRDCQDDAILVAPSIDRINSWLLNNDSSRNREVRTARLKNVLFELRQIGFNRLWASSFQDSVESLREAGFPDDLYTRIEHFSSPLLLARELYHINQSIKNINTINSWAIGESVSAVNKLAPSVRYDMLLLRGLAVGSIVIRNVAKRSLGGAYPSLPLFGILKSFGLSGTLYGAVDKESASVLHLPLYDELLAALGADDREILA